MKVSIVCSFHDYDMYVDRSGRCDAMRQDVMVSGIEGRVVVVK